MRIFHDLGMNRSEWNVVGVKESVKQAIKELEASLYGEDRLKKFPRPFDFFHLNLPFSLDLKVRRKKGRERKKEEIIQNRLQWNELVMKR